MKNNVIKAAGIQIFCNTSKQGMLEKAEKYMEQAIQNYPDIDLFVLPEQFTRWTAMNMKTKYMENMSMVCLKNG